MGLEKYINNSCLFTWRKDGLMIVMILYADDIIIASNYPEKLSEIIKKLYTVFQMKTQENQKPFWDWKLKETK